MSKFGDLIRNATNEIVRHETEYTENHSLSPAQLNARQHRLTEAEFSHRLRSSIDDLDTFLNAQGPRADRDIVSDSYKCELEVKYFCTVVPQGGDIPLSDWLWLVRRIDRSPIREFDRLAVAFFPRGRPGVSVKGQELQPNDGEKLFQDCLSFAPAKPDDYQPYWPVTKVIQPASITSGKSLKPKISFLPESESKSKSIVVVDQSEKVFVRVDVIGNHTMSPVWALVYEVVDEEKHRSLASDGYDVLEKPWPWGSPV